MAANTYSIYSLSDPISNQVRYIGLTSSINNRYKQHLADKRTSHKKAWLSSLKSQGIYPSVDIIESDLSLEQAFKKEISYILLFKSMGAKLVNMTIGGEAPMANKKHSESTLLKMKTQRSKENNSFFGKRHSKETIEIISKKLKGKPSWSLGVKFTKEHKEKLAFAKIGYSPPNKGVSSINFAEVFKLKRDGYSQKEIAIQLKCDPSNISRILNNKYKNRGSGTSKVSTSEIL